MKSVKIALVTHSFRKPLLGGVDVYADRLGRALRRMGHEITIIAVDSDGAQSEQEPVLLSEKEGPFVVKRIRFAFDSRPKEAFDLLYDPQIGDAFFKVLSDSSLDLVIFLNFYTVTYAAVEAAKQHGLPVFHIATDFLPVCRRATLVKWNGKSCETGETVKHCASCFVSSSSRGRMGARLLEPLGDDALLRLASYEYRLLNPLMLLNPYWRQVRITQKRLDLHSRLRPLIDKVFVPTHFTYDMFMRGDFSEDQLQFQPFGIESNDPLSSIRHKEADHIRFLFIGRFQPYKGADILIKAFKGLRRPGGATLTIYGAGEEGYETYFGQLEELLAGESNIHFLGQIDPADLGQAFANADYFVLPSTWHENSPLILLSALQSKTPVISSAIGGVTDLVKDRENGYLFEAGNIAALRDALQLAIDTPQQVEALRSGINLVTIDDYANVIIDAFDHLTRLTHESLEPW